MPIDISSLYPILPSWLALRSYQQQAIDNWFANKGRGTLKMATGSGKTITALAIAAHLYCKSAEQKKPQGLLIVCPYRHLVTQWAQEARKFGLKPIFTRRTEISFQNRCFTVASGLLEYRIINPNQNHQCRAF